MKQKCKKGITQKKFKLVGALSFAVTFAVVSLGGYLFNCVKASNEMQTERLNQTQTEQNFNSNEVKKPQTNSNISINGFDPVNDPVLFTTNSGIKIRFHQENSDFPLYQKLDSITGLAGYPYITTYSDEDGDGVEEPYNWVIIGYGDNCVYSGEIDIDDQLGKVEKQKDPIYVENVDYNFIEFLQNMDTTSPAGRAIANDGGIFNYYGKFNYGVMNGTCNFENLFKDNGPVKNTDELGQGEVLCLSEYCLGKAKFDKNNTTATYSKTENIDGNMRYWMEHCYIKENDIVTSSKFGLGTLPIQYKNLITGNDSAGNVQDSSYSAYVFPLATKYRDREDSILHPDYKQNFNIEYYLHNDEEAHASWNGGTDPCPQMVTYQYNTNTIASYWLRNYHMFTSAGVYYGYHVNPDKVGQINNWGVIASWYLRPAFVLSLL